MPTRNDDLPLRSVAEQSDAELGGPGSVLVRQRRDHEELDRLIRRVEATTGDAQDEALEDLCRLVFPHAFAGARCSGPRRAGRSRTARR